MTARTVLFIGGTGIISSACTARLVELGWQVTLLLRGKSARPIPDGVEVLRGNVREDAGAVRSLLGDRRFDAVVDWVAFVPGHVETDLELFAGRTGQLVLISSASAYQTPPRSLPVTESTPLVNPYWQYSRDKIACEERLMRAHREQGVPITIVRPSHTYDATLLPPHGGWTVVDRLRRGAPVVVHGDGSSLWVVTHHRDFARGFCGLLGHPAAIGDSFHVTTDELLTWDEIHRILAEAAGAPAPKLVHVPSDVIARFDAEWGDSLLGDKTHSMIFDNSKVRRLVPDFRCTIPFAEGAREIVAWHDADPSRKVVDPEFDALCDRLCALDAAAHPS